jgi:protein O-GlcNAc transferase
MRLDLSHYLSKPAIDAPIPSPHSQPQRRARSWALTVGGSFLVVAFLFPTLLSSAYFSTGTRALEAVPDAAASAAASLEQARRWAPADPEIDRALARAYLRLKQPQRAVEALERAFRLRPDSLLIREELADAYAASAQSARAVDVWATMGVKPGDMLQFGEQARQARRYDEALQWYQRAAHMLPDTIDALVGAGRVYREIGRYDDSLTTLRRAADANPSSRDPWYEVGQIYVARKEWADALQAFRHGLGAADGQIGTSNFYYWIGYIQQYSLKPADTDGAWAIYTEALQTNDYRLQPFLKADTFYQRAVILVTRKQWREAADEYRQALMANQNHYVARVGLAQSLWQLGHHDAAVATARDAAEKAPNRKEAYRLLGAIYRDEGKSAEARAMYSRILELDPGDAAAQKEIDALP